MVGTEFFRPRPISNGMEPKLSPQNLIRQVNPEAPVKRHDFYKPLAMDLLTVASAFSVGYLYRQFLVGAVNYALLLLGVTVFSVLSVLSMLLTKELAHRLWIIILEVVALLGLFYTYNLKILGIVAALTFLLMFCGDVFGRRELDNVLEISFFRTTRPVLKKLTTALLLMFVILYLPQLNENTMFVSEANFQKFYDWVAASVANFYPEINPSTSFEKFAEGIARVELKNNPTFENLAAADQDSAIVQTAGDLVKNLGKSLGVTITGDELTSDVLYNVIIKFLNSWRDRFGSFFDIGWVLVVFIVLRILGVIFYLIVGLISFLVYEMLLASNFMHVLGETRTHEVLEY